MIHIFVIMTRHMTLYMAIGDGSFATESTDIWIFASMNLYVEVYVLCDVGCGVWLYIPNFLLMTRNNVFFSGHLKCCIACYLLHAFPCPLRVYF